MAIKARTTVTLTSYRDTQSVTRYYKLQPAGSSAPLKPETKPPSSDWTDSEPDCDISKELYFCDLTIFSNGQWEYSKVSKSSSYEAAKEAYNKAQAAKDSIDNLEIGGRNLILKSETKPISKYIDAITTQTGIKVSEWGTNNAIRSYGVCNSNKIFGTLATGSSSPASALGQAYVHSIYVKNNGETPIIISNNGIGGSRTIQPGESTRVILHGTGDNARYLQFVFFSSNLDDAFDVTYWHPKIEIGDKATDWTPAPEDVDEGIKNAANVAKNYIHPDSTNGLVVNNNQTVGVGYDVQLKANGSDTGMNIRKDGNILASFLQDSVSLGKNSINSRVGMCGDKGGVSASFGYYIDSVSSNNAEMGSTLDFDFNETTFKNKVGQEVGFYDFSYTSVDGWTLFDYVNDTSYPVTLSQYGITLRTPTSSLNDHAQIVINYVLDGSVKFYNADISNPVRKLELEMAENPSSSESDFANITIERQSGTYANGDGKEHSIITMMTLHEFANVATLQLFDDSISLDATHVHLTSTGGEGSILLNGDTNIEGDTKIWGQFQVVNLAGEIKMWAGNEIPYGWLLCDGSEVSKTDYPELYGAIGDLWGTPNSSSNFKLPNLNGRVPVGYNSSDTDFATVGKTGGEKTHKLTITEMPAHNHSRNYYSSNWCANGSKSGYHGNSAGSDKVTGSRGGNGAHNNLQPYAVVKYIICAI